MVETFRQREVNPSSQTPGYQNVSYSPDAYGAQVGRALIQLGQTGTQLAQNQAKLDSEKKANDALTYRNEASDKLRPILYDPQFGVYAQQGQNAMGTGLTTAAALDNVKKETLKNIKDPETARTFEKLWLREEEQIKDKVALHEMNQLGQYKVQTAKATLLGGVTDAYNNYNDPKAIESSINKSIEAIRVNAEGLPPEAVALAEKEARSQIQLAVISRYASEDPEAALDYYTKHKDQLSGKDHIVATQFVDTANTMRKAGNTFRNIVGSGGAAANWLTNAQIQAESSGDPTQVSPKGAAGLMQVMPATARELLIARGQTELAQLPDDELTEVLKKDTQLNVALGSTYMNQMLQRYGGDVEAALVAYNAGPGGADDFLAHNAGVPPGQRDYNVPGRSAIKSETEAYVKKILTQAPGGGGVSTPPGYRMTRENWALKNFAPEDLMAPTEGGQWVDARAAQGLDELATRMGQRFPGLRISINERGDTGSTAGKRRGTSDPKDNPHVKKSKHLEGTAFDVQTQSWSDEQKAAFITEARSLGFRGFGFYGPQGHLHIDMGNERTWGTIPDWAKGPLATPAGQGPIPAGNSQVPGSGVGSLTDGLPSTSVFSGPGAFSAQSAFMSTKAPDLQNWLAQSETIVDPKEREMVQAQIRVYAAQQESLIKSEKAALQQGAWDTVIQSSVQNLTADVLSRLEPSFINSLYAYEENRAKGTMPMDWNAWTQVQAMDSADLAKLDPMTLRNQLDNSHFDQLLTLYREAVKKENGQAHDNALLEGARTTAQISADMTAAQGWKSSTTAGASAIAEFNKQLDARILGEQQIKGSKLTSTEIQDIADKLLINDKTSTLGFNSGQGQALNVENPNEFLAASEWTDVEPDDQKQVIYNYEQNFPNDTPDQEKATDYYNRAMRVWLGGTPDGPEEEKNLLLQSFVATYGRKPSDKEFEKLHGRYLLSYLGR